MREERVKLGGEARAGGGVGLAQAGERELPRAEERELELGGLLRKVEAAE